MGLILAVQGDQLQLFCPHVMVAVLQAAGPLQVAAHGPSALHTTWSSWQDCLPKHSTEQL